MKLFQTEWDSPGTDADVDCAMDVVVVRLLDEDRWDELMARLEKSLLSLRVCCCCCCCSSTDVNDLIVVSVISIRQSIPYVESVAASLLSIDWGVMWCGKGGGER